MILQGCPECHRQYDITTVPAGRRVRCACGAVLTVKIPGEITVRARKCGNCGGAIELGEKACGFCSSKLVELDLDATLCPQCYRRIEGDARHCQGCGIRIRPQALTPLGEDVTCPRCSGELRARSMGEHCVVECTGCEGLWVAADVFAELCRRAREAPGEIPTRPKGVGEDKRGLEKVRYLPCVSCGELMLRRNFRYGERSSRVIVDLCKDHGVWLDNGELEQLMRFLSAQGSNWADGGADERALKGSLQSKSIKKNVGLPSLHVGHSPDSMFDGWWLGGFLAAFLEELF